VREDDGRTLIGVHQMSRFLRADVGRGHGSSRRDFLLGHF
jgi:hypothetical protein